jgi:hypothetical protein
MIAASGSRGRRHRDSAAERGIPVPNYIRHLLYCPGFPKRPATRAAGDADEQHQTFHACLVR